MIFYFVLVYLFFYVCVVFSVKMSAFNVSWTIKMYTIDLLSYITKYGYIVLLTANNEEKQWSISYFILIQKIYKCIDYIIFVYNINDINILQMYFFEKKCNFDDIKI